MKITAAISMNLGTSMTFAAPARNKSRTGGPDNDDEELLVRRLLPILATVITLAFVFS